MSPWRKTILLLLTGLLLCIPAGCWSRRETNELAFVMAVGLDGASGGGPYRVTIQVAKPKTFAAKPEGGSQGEKTFEVYTAGGATPAEAMRNLSRQVPRRLLLAHSRFILISERLAASGMKPVLDFFQRNHEFRETAWLLVARGEAKDLLTTEVDLENIPAETISRLVKYSEESSRGYAVTMRDFAKKIITRGVDPVAQSVVILPGAIQGGKPKAQLAGFAVFRGDRLAGWLNEKETRGFLWVTGKARTGTIVLDAPEGQGRITFEFLRARRKLTPEIRDGRFVIKLAVDTEGLFGDMNVRELPTAYGTGERERQALVEVVERRAEAAIRGEVHAALRKAQREYLADVFGFGQAIRRRFPREWQAVAERWDQVYPSVDVQIEVDVRLRASGLACTHRCHEEKGR